MKYAQLIMGLLVGTALGGAVVASQGNPMLAATTTSTAPDSEAIKQIVRDTIMNEPKLILDSVSKFQNDQRVQAVGKASEAVNDKDTRAAIFDDISVPFIGNKNGKHQVAEFFDYNCPVCKMQFKTFTELLAKDKELKIVFHEFPIFGPTSDENSKIGIAVAKLYPEKYYPFHEKMMEGRGHEQNTDRTISILKELGMDGAKIQEYAKSDEAEKQLAKSRALGEKLQIQGTPTMVVGTEVIPHAIDAGQLEQKLNATPAP